MTKRQSWGEVTFEGVRRARHMAFLDLPFAEKVKRLEQAQEVSEFFALQQGISGKAKKERGWKV